MTHLFVAEDGLKHHGIAQYPIDDWKAQGEPIMTTRGWVKLCLRVAAKDMANLKNLFTLCTDLEAKL
eukprot:451087-Prorocentrum_lima.AAC.1